MTQQERANAPGYTPAPDLRQFLEETRPPGYGVIYVASPYWHPDPRIRRARAHAAQTVTSGMIQRGEPVFSPIVYSASIQEVPGWEQSRGILIELGFARARGIPLERMGFDRIGPLLDEDTRRTLLEI